MEAGSQMADIVEKRTRSRIMAGIKGKDTRPELALQKAMHAHDFRCRLHIRDIVGRPDIVLSRHRAVVFVYGCFWHRRTSCRLAVTPAIRPEFWQAKFARNVSRDASVRSRVVEEGWRVAVKGGEKTSTALFHEPQWAPRPNVSQNWGAAAALCVATLGGFSWLACVGVARESRTEIPRTGASEVLPRYPTKSSRYLHGLGLSAASHRELPPGRRRVETRLRNRDNSKTEQTHQVWGFDHTRGPRDRSGASIQWRKQHTTVQIQA
jgi:DNA mismatch endonuclease (patch repair protein)